MHRASPAAPRATPVRRPSNAPVLAILLTLTALAGPLQAQDLRDRSPNHSGGWVGEPGSAHFHFVHRFRVANGNVVNTPTMLLALPLPGSTLTGMQFSSNSGVAPGEANEWEGFVRWAPRPFPNLGVRPALTGAYNTATGSVDGELSLSASVDRFRLLGAGRFFSDAFDSGASGWALSGGFAVDVSDHLALAADYGASWIDGQRDRPTWGAGLHARIPATPHTVSLHATNTRTGTLQGASGRARTLWGFEFTVPVTFARYRSAPTEPEEAVGVEAGVTEVTMTDDLRFTPEVLEVRAGETVIWRNTTDIPHTVTLDPDRVRDPDQIALPDGAAPFDSGNMAPGEAFSHTFTEPGEYVYVCVPHDTAPMVGTIRVVP